VTNEKPIPPAQPATTAAMPAAPPSPFNDDEIEWLRDPEEDAPGAPSTSPVTHVTLQDRGNFLSAGEFVLKQGRDVWVTGRTFVIPGKNNAPRVKLQLARQKRTGRVIPAWQIEPARINLEGPEVEKLYAELTAARANLGAKEETAYLLIQTGADPNITGLEALLTLIAKDPESLASLTGAVAADQLSALRAVVNLGRFKVAREELAALILANPPEGTFQRWFEENDWVFGTEYIERRTKGSRHISADSIIDLIFFAVDGFADIFELKRPGVDVFVQPHGRTFYIPSPDLNAAFGQAVHSLADADNAAMVNLATRDMLLYRPRVRLVIGRSNEWTQAQHRAYRETTAAWNRIELLTYDMVLKRIDNLIATMTRDLRAATQPPVTEATDIFG
jgi:hypothetical protein